MYVTYRYKHLKFFKVFPLDNHTLFPAIFPCTVRILEGVNEDLVQSFCHSGLDASMFSKRALFSVVLILGNKMKSAADRSALVRETTRATLLRCDPKKFNRNWSLGCFCDRQSTIWGPTWHTLSARANCR